MKNIFLLFCFLTSTSVVFASQADTVSIPLFRQGFHDKIDKEQLLVDKADNMQDGYLHLSKNEEINLQVSDVIFRKIDELQIWVETNELIATNNDKIRYLRLIENVIKNFRIDWRKKDIKPIDFPSVYNTFESILKGMLSNSSMLPVLEASSYEVAKLNTSVFFELK